MRSRPATIPGRHLPLSCGQSLRPPLKQPIGGGHFHETSSKVHRIHPSPRGNWQSPRSRKPSSSRRSSPRPRPPDGTTAASASTSGFAPRSYPRRTPRRRQAIAHWPGYYTTGLSRTSSGASHLNSCTLTSHVIGRGLHDDELDPAGEQPPGQCEDLSRCRGDLFQPRRRRPPSRAGGRRVHTSCAGIFRALALPTGASYP